MLSKYVDYILKFKTRLLEHRAIHDVPDTLYLLNIAKNEWWKYLLPLYKYHNIMNLEKALAEATLKHAEAHV